MQVQKMTLGQVKAYVRKHGAWDGYMIACKMILDFKQHGSHIHLSMNSVGDLIDDRYNKAFVITLDQWLYYSNSETGLYPHYYRIVA